MPLPWYTIVLLLLVAAALVALVLERRRGRRSVENPEQSRARLEAENNLRSRRSFDDL